MYVQLSHLTHSNAIVSECVDLNAVMCAHCEHTLCYTTVLECVHVCVCARLRVCVCKFTCGNSMNGVTPDKKTSERYNFTSTLAIQMYLDKHIYLCK